MDNDRQKTWTGERLETFVYSDNTNEHLHRYAMAMELAAGKKVLDIACGEGYGTALLAGVAAEVCGVDIDAGTVQHAIEKYQAANLSFATGAADAIPYESRLFDVVVSFETIEHHDRHDAMMQEIKRVLKPNGILIISSPDKLYYSDRTGYKNPFHVKELYKDEFENLVRKYFLHANFYGQRSLNGSVIVALNNKGIDGDRLYSGAYEQVNAGSMEAVYCVAIASDENLPPGHNSVFDGAHILRQQFIEFEKYITANVTEAVSHAVEYRIARSWTYRIGSAIVRPFYKLKKILHA